MPLWGPGAFDANPGLFMPVAGARVAFTGPLDYWASMYEFTNAPGREEDGLFISVIPVIPGPLAPGAIQAKGHARVQAISRLDWRKGSGLARTSKASTTPPVPQGRNTCPRQGKARAAAMEPVVFVFPAGGAQSNGPAVSNPSCMQVVSGGYAV